MQFARIRSRWVQLASSQAQGFLETIRDGQAILRPESAISRRHGTVATTLSPTPADGDARTGTHENWCPDFGGRRSTRLAADAPVGERVHLGAVGGVTGS